MNYPERLRESYNKFGSIVCMGMDPVLSSIPIKDKSISNTIQSFYLSILNTMVKKNILPSAVKPNYAFYAQYGFEGLEALAFLIKQYKSASIPVILDVKRGDIGTTADAYSHESFGFFDADAVTLSPYMGSDSIKPFFNNYPERGCYILNRTSNKSAVEIQNCLIDGNPLYIYVAHKIVEWYMPGIGAVVGATYPKELSAISEIFNKSGKDIPLLIPGIGTQGGDVEAVCRVLSSGNDFTIHRINSSGAINYAYKQFPELHFAEAAVKALEILTEQTNRHLKV
jgi:orotidine-5'-phosphate decarboxylase